MSPSQPIHDQPVRLTIRDGGWVLIIAAALVGGLMLWSIITALGQSGPRLMGDGEHLESYGFVLEPSLLPDDAILASPLQRDLMSALVMPRALDRAALAEDLKTQRGKYLVSTDRIIGVVINGEARAYPLQLLNWHAIANDVVGGRAIAVTYDPLCDSAIVYDRTVGGETREFRVSGLIYNSNLLMFDARPQGDPVESSLWCQIQGRAVVGPAAADGLVLDALPCSLTHWGDWTSHHPDTTVLTRNPTLIARYNKIDYSRYYKIDEIHFPITPVLEPGGRAPKARVVQIAAGDERRVFALSDLAAKVGTGSWTTDLAGRAVTFSRVTDETAIIDAPADVDVRFALWFAWHAMVPDAAAVAP
ncbi:MAG: DUF3179 domain-containing protein [Phycisphaerales bacterium]|nr:DUF3179 domain-containing protein [Phycisphaerales bacterium]